MSELRFPYVKSKLFIRFPYTLFLSLQLQSIWAYNQRIVTHVQRMPNVSLNYIYIWHVHHITAYIQCITHALTYTRSVEHAQGLFLAVLNAV